MTSHAQARPVPADLHQTAPGKTIAAVASLYKAGPATVGRWLRLAGLEGVVVRGIVAPPPADFSERFTGWRIEDVCRATSKGAHVVKRWFRETGTRGWQPPTFSSGRNARVTGEIALKALGTRIAERVDRDVTAAGLAADFLRRLGPVWRCDADGKPNPTGTHWRRGSAILSDAEIIERADAQRGREARLAA